MSNAKTKTKPKPTKLAPVKRTIFRVFQEHGRAVDYNIRSLIPQDCIEAARAKLGADAAKKLEATLETMDKADLDFLQVKIGDRRVRVMQEVVG